MKSLGRILRAVDALREEGLFGFWRNRKRNHFIVVTFRCLGQLAKAKGRVTDADIATAVDLMRRLQLSDDQSALARESFRQGRSPNLDTVWLIRQLQHRLGHDVDESTLFMQCQFQLAYADGQLGPTDKALIQRWARALGLRSARLRRVHKQTLQIMARQRTRDNRTRFAMTEKEARAVLGVSPEASAPEIRRQYQRAMHLYHPDKWVGRNATPRERADAEEKARRLQEAYETLRRRE